MNKNEIKILSPLTIIAVGLLDLSVVAVTIFAIKKLIENVSTLTIAFAFMDLLAVVVAILVSKEIVSNKIVFTNTGFELIGLDNDNKYNYCDIEKIEYQKDDAISFKKNFNDRHAVIILTLKKDKIASIDLGLITKGKLLKIVKQIENKISK